MTGGALNIDFAIFVWFAMGGFIITALILSYIFEGK